MKTLVISIDFELRWGLLDILGKDIEKYKLNIQKVHENIPWILKVFEERKISATWATVGALGCDNWDEFDQVKPKNTPSYQNTKLIYDNDFNRNIDPEGKLYFAPNLIKNIINTKNQELASHTFGHIYGTEEHVSYEEIKEDLETCKNFLLNKFDVEPISLVYPRNQVIYENRLIEDKIIKFYRGNEKVEFLSAKNQQEGKLTNRAKIFLDTLNPYSSHSINYSELENNNIPSSGMFRIYLPNLLRKMHLFKLRKNIMDLKENEIYHTWFHPHNLGFTQDKKDDFLKFYDFIGNLIATNKLQSKAMKDFTFKNESICAE